MEIERIEASLWTDADGISHLQLWADGEKVREAVIGEIGLDSLHRVSVARTEAEVTET